MKEFVQKDFSVEIQGKEYKLRELSLAQKIRVIQPIAGFLKEIAKCAFFKKNDEGSISFHFIDEITLSELNVDKIILGSLEILPELLALSIPDIKDWDNIPESDTREARLKAVEINDFGGFIRNFISLGAMITH